MSNKMLPDESLFGNLKDKVVVMTGGANGIGAKTVELLIALGANVVFGDFDAAASDALVTSLGSPSNLTFVRTDVTSYTANIALFKAALEKYGRVDHAIACAGIIEQGQWFDPELTVESVEKEPPTTVLDVNLKGTAYFARIAIVYLRHGMTKGEDKSLLLISSAAGFRESPGLFIYQASKHGVVGLMRSMRRVVWPRDGIRVNTVCPGMVDTNMTSNIIDLFRSTNQAINMPVDIARMILAVMTAPGMNGKSVYVEAGTGWEIEDGLIRTMPEWVGEAPAKRILDALGAVGQGDAWKIK